MGTEDIGASADNNLASLTLAFAFVARCAGGSEGRAGGEKRSQKKGDR